MQATLTKLIAEAKRSMWGKNGFSCDLARNSYVAEYLIANGATMLPCKIGDEAWGIRNYKGVKHPQQGRIDEMYFTKDMRLLIKIKHVCIGEWGEKIFASYEEAEAALSEPPQEG